MKMMQFVRLDREKSAMSSPCDGAVLQSVWSRRSLNPASSPTSAVARVLTDSCGGGDPVEECVWPSASPACGVLREGGASREDDLKANFFGRVSARCLVSSPVSSFRACTHGSTIAHPTNAEAAALGLAEVVGGEEGDGLIEEPLGGLDLCLCPREEVALGTSTAAAASTHSIAKQLLRSPPCRLKAGPECMHRLGRPTSPLR